MEYAAAIPTLNPGETLLTLIDSLLGQTISPKEILIVDSGSEDGFPEAAEKKERVQLISIRRETFDHGGTRDMALRSCKTPVVVMMTQDALPVNDRCMEELMKPFADQRVAAVCARQVAYAHARTAEKAVRAFRYPEVSDAWEKKDLQRKGISAFLLSDTCTAYRVSAYTAVGGFTHPIATNEDMLIAADFLDAGYKLAYQAEAAVWHSHDYTLRQEYERNRKIGQFLQQYGHRFGDGKVAGEGMKMVKYVSGRLIKEGKIGEVIPFWFNCAARLLGNRAGKKAGK